MRLLLLSALFLTIAATTSAQTRYTAAVDSLDIRYQQCMAKGQDMYSCAIEYYQQLDSMLQAVYEELYERLGADRQTVLKTDQDAWIQQRDRYFKTIDTKAAKSLFGLDDQTIAADNKAAYIKDRVVALLKEAELN
ncbi:DUF1311 domain-containing protein [Chitinophaga pendula]|uniref:lysozyme inhibitor LprI family protein n=1 Tax=Chitinophaga TaxID=79328 RepID=UPI000BAF44C3|nr:MULTISPECIES: lysozyme inhibitor LprI family protein [Chitinophaga]ASZ10317.1 hypothetical protein CK934_04630 [Chitinophaga sp. MD30]UCJ06721.1 DUF1311 domain-containing protein [Chitinophaga pendula]